MPSENGWEPSWTDQSQVEWYTVPGTSVRLQSMKGWPLVIMRAFAADYNAYVEPLRDPDSASYTATNSVATSNHLNGTAFDLNWNTHPFKVKGTFTLSQMRTIRELLEFYEGTMFWAGDWKSPIDEMHWQMGYGTYGDPRLGDFIDRKIRSDGFSTFRRGELQAPPAVHVLADATGLSVGRALEILPTVQEGLRLSECTNVNRIAMWLAQIGHESAGFKATEEYASGAAYEGRSDLGNTQPGDGVRFKGRTWIQITGRHNYGKFSQWCSAKKLVPSPTEFLANPNKLADLEWAGIGPAWYWTVARSDINELCDRRDIRSVTRRINGGLNGIDDRISRFNRAIAISPRLKELLKPPAQPETIEEILMLRAPSLSIYADPGEEDPSVVDMIRALDAHGPHEPFVEKKAREGDFDALSRVIRTAAGKGQFGSAVGPVSQARMVLNEIEQMSPDILRNYNASKGLP